MDTHHVRLSSAEIGGLWETYLLDSAIICLLKYCLHHAKDEEIKGIIKKTIDLAQNHLNDVSEIFMKEQIVVPNGLTDDDINLSAPPLFYETYSISCVYMVLRMSIINFSFTIANVARPDILDFFSRCIREDTKNFNEVVNLMLSKGLYDRPPMIPYPKEKEYIKKKNYIFKSIGEKRPLNALELSEVFFNIERNYFAVILCMGLLQVVKDKKFKSFISEGKEISEKQINYLNDLLKDENLLGIVSVNVEVTDSTESPFSDRLIIALFTLLNGLDITLLGRALSKSLRADLSAFYSKTIAEILLYSVKGFNLMVEHGWMEEPPHAPNRHID